MQRLLTTTTCDPFRRKIGKNILYVQHDTLQITSNSSDRDNSAPYRLPYGRGLILRNSAAGPVR
jgi:hypothetical protein